MAEEKQSDPWVEALAAVKLARELAGALTTPEGAGFSVTGLTKHQPSQGQRRTMQ